jgi:hypothetical protein
MNFDIKITNIIEWIIAISLGIIGWFIAIKSTLSQQEKERYNDLIQDFHMFIYNFRFNFLQDLIKENNNKYIIQNINHQIKFIYYKAKDIDSLTRNKKNKIFEKIKKAGEEFADSALLDHDIENALISKEKDTKIEIQKKNFLQFADKFVETCYSVTGFSIK